MEKEGSKYGQTFWRKTMEKIQAKCRWQDVIMDHTITQFINNKLGWAKQVWEAIRGGMGILRE